MDIPSKQKMVINAMHQTKYLKWKIPIDNPWKIIHTNRNEQTQRVLFIWGFYVYITAINSEEKALDVGVDSEDGLWEVQSGGDGEEKWHIYTLF